MSSSSERGTRNCALCGRCAEDVYCVYHEKARSQIELGFKAWVEAFEILTWERYLERILELEETGEWAREVARHLLIATKKSMSITD